MTEPKTASSQSSLFARKGEAAPSPAVAYVSLRQLQGKPDRRKERPDGRRDQRHLAEQGSAPEAPEQRSADRRHYTPASGLALGQRPVPWRSAEARSDDSQATTPERAVTRDPPPLSSLIVRHGVASAPPAPWEPEPTIAARRVGAIAPPATPRPEPAAPQQPQAPPAASPTKIDPLKYLSAAGARGRRTAAAPSPAKPCEPLAAKRSPYGKRKKLTLRLGQRRFKKFKEIADKTDRTYQSILLAALKVYLEEKT